MDPRGDDADGIVDGRARARVLARADGEDLVGCGEIMRVV